MPPTRETSAEGYSKTVSADAFPAVSGSGNATWPTSRYADIRSVNRRLRVPGDMDRRAVRGRQSRGGPAAAGVLVGVPVAAIGVRVACGCAACDGGGRWRVSSSRRVAGVQGRRVGDQERELGVRLAVVSSAGCALTGRWPSTTTRSPSPTSPSSPTRCAVPAAEHLGEKLGDSSTATACWPPSAVLALRSPSSSSNSATASNAPASTARSNSARPRR